MVLCVPQVHVPASRSVRPLYMIYGRDQQTQPCAQRPCYSVRCNRPLLHSAMHAMRPNYTSYTVYPAFRYTPQPRVYCWDLCLSICYLMPALYVVLFFCIFAAYSAYFLFLVFFLIMLCAFITVQVTACSGKLPLLVIEHSLSLSLSLLPSVGNLVCWSVLWEKHTVCTVSLTSCQIRLRSECKWQQTRQTIH